ncbi:MAG: hypothetical protein ASARMPRED_002006 [Alectoria sarmentosa]|nr:MAG: hypothetical protein ASARMPRED_002006 [Alectoria sarmentosa]
MNPSGLVERVQELTDLELAMLLSLVAGQHCIITAEQDDLDPLEQELHLIAANVFALSHNELHCNESTTLEDFSDGILVESIPSNRLDNGETGTSMDSDQSSRRHDGRIERNPASPKQPIHTNKTESQQNDRTIANVVLITGLSLASENIQIQALELLRTKRIFTHTAIHTAPKTFLLVVVASSKEPRLNHHLRDHIFISHYHSQEDGFANLEEASEWIEDDRASVSSVIHRSTAQESSNLVLPHSFTQQEVRYLADQSEKIKFTAEIKAYQQNIITFLRLHRAVGNGVSPRATQHLVDLVKYLAVIHGQTYVSPSLVALAIHKIYPHRITILEPEAERRILSIASDRRNPGIGRYTDLERIIMAASSSDGVFLYPDPSFFGLNAPPPPFQPDKITVFSKASPPAAPVVAAPAPPFALDPALLALSGPSAVPTPAPVVAAPAPAPASAGPVPAPFAAAPRLSVVGVMFPGFPAGLVPPMQINGANAATYNQHVKVAYNTTNAGLRSGKLYVNSQSLDDRTMETRARKSVLPIKNLGCVRISTSALASRPTEVTKTASSLLAIAASLRAPDAASNPTMAVQIQSSVQTPVALAPRVGQANTTPSSSAALPPFAAGIIMIADPHPMDLTKPNKRTRYDLRSSIGPAIRMRKYILKHNGNDANLSARLSTDKRRLVEMKREAQGTPVPPVQGIYDWYKAGISHGAGGPQTQTGTTGSGTVDLGGAGPSTAALRAAPSTSVAAGPSSTRAARTFEAEPRDSGATGPSERAPE